MPLDARVYLQDVLSAVQDIREFTRGVEFEEYSESRLLISAVERQLSIIGEAVTQLLKLETGLTLTDARAITGFRNILIHNYARVNQAVVWTIVQDNFPLLEQECKAALERLNLASE